MVRGGRQALARPLRTISWPWTAGTVFLPRPCGSHNSTFDSEIVAGATRFRYVIHNSTLHAERSIEQRGVQACLYPASLVWLPARKNRSGTTNQNAQPSPSVQRVFFDRFGNAEVPGITWASLPTLDHGALLLAVVSARTSFTSSKGATS